MEQRMTQQLTMHGKRALVTGSGTGIGREVALEFARQGAAVALHYSHSTKGASSAVEEIYKSGGKAQAFAANFADVGQVQKLAAEALAFLGGMDILINNAGVTFNMPFEKVTQEQFDTLYSVNVRAQFFLTQALVPVLAQSRGVIINLSSIHACQGAPGHSVYAGTKGAIIAYTRELAIELSTKGIRVNCIVPGAVTVASHREVLAFDPDDLGNGIPAGFAGGPSDIAKLAVFLAGPDSRYILGQSIVIDGGTTSWISFGEGFKQQSDAPFGRGYVPGI
jgi:NAD(P)-dependent dehydrogenase (short-subunit alcohol dehydrogenase family)